ncbi:MAG TPA: hypothetical protein EYG11_18665 [Candidatus Latescibacteria bacterium]|nr:hypothetical protein [Candidatus Latescibacterota bacterium]
MMTAGICPTLLVSLSYCLGKTNMKGKTHSTEEIICILRQADGGQTAQAVCREYNISEQAFYQWR